MRTLIKFLFVLLMFAFVSGGCSSGRKSYSELRGLMLLENTQLGRNRTYYSKHKSKRIKDYHRKFNRKSKQ